MKEDTLIVTAGRSPEDNYGIVNPPVYHASTVLFPTVAELERSQLIDNVFQVNLSVHS